MTRLTQEQIAEAWDDSVAKNPPKNVLAFGVWGQIISEYRIRIAVFAHRIAALAVQEVERERDEYRGAYARAFEELKESREQVATLTAQLAEARNLAEHNGKAADEAVIEARALRAQITDAQEEREKAEWFAKEWEKAADVLAAQLATAKREDREREREAFKRGFSAGAKLGSAATIGHMLDATQREYPATPSGEGENDQCACGDVAVRNWEGYAFCAKCCVTPSPEAREVPPNLCFPVHDEDGEILKFKGNPVYVKFTPADAKRIVAMGTE